MKVTATAKTGNIIIEVRYEKDGKFWRTTISPEENPGKLFPFGEEEDIPQVVIDLKKRVTKAVKDRYKIHLSKHE